MAVLLKAMTPPNRLACLISLESGLRIGDVLAIRSEQMRQKSFTIFEEKTGKKRTVRLSPKLREEVLKYAGRVYAFPHRTKPLQHRTRQAVWKDLKRAAKLFRVETKRGISPHTMRKCYTKTLRDNGVSLSEASKRLNHSNPLVTAIYYYADCIDVV